MKRLEKPRLRLERANMHQRRFGELWNAFLDEDEPYETRVLIYGDGEGVIFVSPSASFPGDELSLEFGEFLYQLRAALDSLVYEVAIIDSGEDPPPDAERLEFPIVSRSENAFKSVAWKIAPLSEQHRDMIDSIQPYRAEYDNDAMRMISEAFEMLNDWARKDRHRGLRVIGSWGANRNPQFELPPGCSLEWVTVTPDGLLEKEGEVARFKVSGRDVGAEMEANPNLSIDVAIDEAPAPRDDSDTLFERVRLMTACVAVTIEGFEKTLD